MDCRWLPWLARQWQRMGGGVPDLEVLHDIAVANQGQKKVGFWPAIAGNLSNSGIAMVGGDSRSF